MLKFNQDMTSGNVTSHLLKFSLPLLMGNLFQQLYSLADTIIVGKAMGKPALAAVGATGSITFLVYSLCMGLATGAGILVSQYFGSGKKDNLKKTITNSAYICLVFGIVLSIIGYAVSKPVLVLLNTEPSVLEDAVTYLRISCIGMLAVCAYNWISSVLRSLGDAVTPFIFLVIASIINVGLDLLFVLVFHWGVAGAAWATIIAQGVSALLSILLAMFKNEHFKFEPKHLKADGDLIKKCISVGMPIAIQSSLIAVSMVVLQRVANGFGETVMATYTVTMRVEQLVQLPYQSLNAAVSTFTGQNIGAGQVSRVKECFKKSTLIALVFSLLMLVVFMIFPQNIMEIFAKKSDTDVISIGATALRISCVFYFFLGMIYVSRGLLNGAGDTIYSMINGIAELIGRVGFSLILVHIPSVGMWAVWGTTCLTWVLTSIASVVRYYQGKWIVVSKA